jgi:dihydrolipoamide dehydrogenase
MKEYDVAVIGGGPGGYVAAIRASQNGKKVVLFEEKHLGGICLNFGCIPTKALLKSAELFLSMKKAADFGIDASEVKPNLSNMVTRSRQVSNKLSGGVGLLLKKNNITVIEKRAILESNSVIKAGDEKYKTNFIILATGARNRVINGFEPDGKNVWSYKEALLPQELPQELIVVGSGAIGIEFASFYNAIGSKVTVLDIAESILPQEDKEVSDYAKKIFEKQGIKFLTNVKLDTLEKTEKNFKLKYSQASTKGEISGTHLLMTVGIVGNIENIGLENTRIKTEKNQILTNNYLQTEEKNIYAIGDVIDGPWLAHKASHEGILAADHIDGKTVHPIVKNNIPSCTYSIPQIASIGLTEQKAKEMGLDYRIGNFPFYANGKALAVGTDIGFMKTLFDKKTGELIGAHLIGDNVTEIISNFALTKSLEGTDLDLINTIFPHPTLSEMIHESSLDSFGKAIHK